MNDTNEKSYSNTSNTLDEDPLMKDCIELRHRLIETEQSLRNLNLTSSSQRSFNTSGAVTTLHTNGNERSLLSDYAPILTLADLTPVSSELEKDLSDTINVTNRMHSSLNDLDYKLNDEGNQCVSRIRGHAVVGNLRKKLFTLHEENSSLFLQNNNLMSELEKNSFKLKQCQQEMKGMSEKKRLNETAYLATIESLKEQIKTKEQTVKKLELIVNELRSHLKEQDAFNREKVNNIKNELATFQDTIKQNTRMKNVIELQENQIDELKGEMFKTKEHMTRLEMLIQKIQEEKLSISKSDSGINMVSNDVTSNSSSRAIIAELNLKLAMKDAQMEKLRAALSTNSKVQEKMQCDHNLEENNMKSLRSELVTLMEKIRQSDFKRSQLEQSIARTEEELSCKTKKVVDLNEQLSDGTALVTSLEKTLENRNEKLIAMNAEMKEQKQHFKATEERLNKSVVALKKTLGEKNWSLEEKERQLEESKSLVNSYSSQIANLENALVAHGEETKATDELVDKIKTLHATHCTELDQEITRLQNLTENQKEVLESVERKLVESIDERKILDCKLTELTSYIAKMEELVIEKNNMVVTYEEKIKVIQSTADKEAEEVKILTKKTNSIQYLTEDIQIKKNHIEKLEVSYKKSLEMLDQSQHRISELEETQSHYEEEMGKMKENSTVESREKKEEFEKLFKSIQKQQHDIKYYQGQLQIVTSTLEDSKQKITGLGEIVATKECQLVENVNKLHALSTEIQNLKKTKNEVECSLNDQKMEYQLLEDEKNRIVNTYTSELEALQHQCTSMNKKIRDAHNKTVDQERCIHRMEEEKQMTSTAYQKIERMLMISNDNVNIKEKLVQEKQQQLTYCEHSLNECKLRFKQKAAQFTQLEMTYKQERSEQEKKITLLEKDFTNIKDEINRKDEQLTSTKKELENLRKEYDRVSRDCINYEDRFKLQDSLNGNTSIELKSLKEDIASCRTKLKHQALLETELNALRGQSEDIQFQAQNLQSELLVSQQNVLDLTNELKQAHSMLSSKEFDCTRLARELGASQVRESQEKARLNEEIRKSLQDEATKIAQKHVIDTFHDENEDLYTTYQNEVMKLRLRLQWSEDGKKTCKSDLEQAMKRIKELEYEVRNVAGKLQHEQQKTKEMNESLLLREAEITRYLARLSCFERAALSNRTESTSDQRNFISTQNLPSARNESAMINDIVPTKKKEIYEFKKYHKTNTLGSSLDALLKRTDQELQNLHLSGISETTDSTFNVSSSDVEYPERP